MERISGSRAWIIYGLGSVAVGAAVWAAGAFGFAAQQDLLVSAGRPPEKGPRSTVAWLEGREVDRVVIDPTTRDPVQTLVNALAAGNRVVEGRPVPIVVELCGVDLDLTGHSIVLGSDRSLIASPACARGPRSLGPGISVTDNRALGRPLFVIRGDNVVFSGFRLKGPSDGIYQGSDRLERAITIDPFECVEGAGGCEAVPIRHIEISNMEIFQWSGAGIDVRDNTVQKERGRLFDTNVAAVQIRNNYIHHNRHGAGNGYGVEVASGAYALIEQNVFDENRHAIMGGSWDGKKDFSGYTVRDNLILAGGGVHCSEAWWGAFCAWRCNCWQTHQIDMHGNVSTFFGGDACCGTAGETMMIERNTVLYDAGYAIKIRGNPADKAVVDGNVFRHGSRGDAIAQNGNPGFGDNITNPIDVRPNNAFGWNALAESATCDFFGDGQKDRFVATGVTWWAQSPVTQQWRYLNTMPERLPRLQLGNVDNDAKCDVALRPASDAVPPRTYSKSGTSPWTPVQVLEQ